MASFCILIHAVVTLFCIVVAVMEAKMISPANPPPSGGKPDHVQVIVDRKFITPKECDVVVHCKPPPHFTVTEYTEIIFSYNRTIIYNSKQKVIAENVKVMNLTSIRIESLTGPIHQVQCALNRTKSVNKIDVVMVDIEEYHHSTIKIKMNEYFTAQCTLAVTQITSTYMVNFVFNDSVIAYYKVTNGVSVFNAMNVAWAEIKEDTCAHPVYTIKIMPKNWYAFGKYRCEMKVVNVVDVVISNEVDTCSASRLAATLVFMMAIVFLAFQMFPFADAVTN